jgi:hypothetical protein
MDWQWIILVRRVKGDAQSIQLVPSRKTTSDHVKQQVTASLGAASAVKQ